MLKNKPEGIIMQDYWVDLAKPGLGKMFLLLQEHLFANFTHKTPAELPQFINWHIKGSQDWRLSSQMTRGKELLPLVAEK